MYHTHVIGINIRTSMAMFFLPSFLSLPLCCKESLLSFMFTISWSVRPLHKLHFKWFNFQMNLTMVQCPMYTYLYMYLSPINSIKKVSFNLFLKIIFKWIFKFDSRYSWALNPNPNSSYYDAVMRNSKVHFFNGRSEQKKTCDAIKSHA